MRLRLPDNLRPAVERLARNEGHSVNEIACQLLREAVHARELAAYRARQGTANHQAR